MRRFSPFTQIAIATLHVLAAPCFAQEEPENIPDWFPTGDSAINAGYSEPVEIQYWRSLTNRSTAGSLIPIKIIDPANRTQNVRMICSGFLIYHFEKEYARKKLKFDRNAFINKAIKVDKLTYLFSKKQELRIFGPGDLQRETEIARSILSKYSNDQIVNLFHPTSGFEMELGSQFGKGPHHNLRYAIAHALFDRGLCVGIGCVNGSLWVRK